MVIGIPPPSEKRRGGMTIHNVCLRSSPSSSGKREGMVMTISLLTFLEKGRLVMVMGIFPLLEKSEAVVMIIGITPSRKGNGVAMTIHNLLLRKSPSSSGEEKEWSWS